MNEDRRRSGALPTGRAASAPVETPLGRLVRLIHSSLRLEEVMERIVAEVARLFGADACALYLRDAETGDFVLRAATGYRPEAVGVTRIAPGEGFTGWAASRREVVCAEDAPADPRYAFRPEMGEEPYRSLLAIPVVRDEETVGVITLQTRARRRFTEAEVDLAAAVAEHVYAAVENARLYRALEERLDEVSRLYEVVRSVGSTLHLDEVLDEIVRQAARILAARGGTVRILAEDGRLHLRASHNLPPGLDPDAAVLALGEGASGEAAATRRPVRRALDRGASPIARHNVLIVPMIHRDRVIGTLGVFDKHDAAGRPVSFTDADERVLALLGQRAAEAIAHAETYGRLERVLGTYRDRVRELEILHKVSRALQSSRTRDEALFVVLTGVTSGKGLGYNRALALLVEGGDTLAGAMGIGPTVEEVGRVWAELPRRFQTLEDYFEEVDLETILASPFHRTVGSIRLPLAPGAPLPARAVLERRAFNVRNLADHPVDRGFAATIRTNAFAVVPIWAGELVIGALVVDNWFNRRPIEDADLQVLETFAHQAGLALESVRLLEEVQEAMRRLEETTQQLVEVQRLAAIGEVAAGIAHDIRNPLTSIGGFTRRIEKALAPDHPARRYIPIVLAEVARLERLAAEVLDFARTRTVNPEEVEVASLVAAWRQGEAARLSEREIELVVGGIPRVRADARLLEQALGNVLRNALDAVGAKGRIAVTARETDTHYEIEVADDGCGMDEETARRALEPFFTTRTEGTGLGLALVEKAMRSHEGRVEIRSHAPGDTRVALVWPKSFESARV